MAPHGVGWGGGWGVTADDDRGCYDPVLVFFSKLNYFEFRNNSVEIPVLEITLLYRLGRDNFFQIMNMF